MALSLRTPSLATTRPLMLPAKTMRLTITH